MGGPPAELHFGHLMEHPGQDNLSPGQLAQLLAVADETCHDRASNSRAEIPDSPEAMWVDDEASPLGPGDRVDQFEIRQEIGRGGMCFVFEAHDTHLDRRVALKVLRPSLARTPSTARRFYRESVMAGGLSDPCLAAIYCQGHCDDGTPYFAMEYIQGHNLAEVVARQGPMAPREVAQMAVECCRALHHAHQKGLIHRDVTCRNILRSASTGSYRLLDFGVAQDTTGRWTQTTQAGGAVGTVAFMSPEQNLSETLDARTDVFSLGLVLYFALTGRSAYQADNRAQLALAFQLQSPVPAHVVRPEVPADLSAIVMRMLAVKREDRYQSCESVQADLRAMLSGRSDLLTGLHPAPAAGPARSLPAEASPKRRATLGYFALAWVALVALLLAGWTFSQQAGLDLFPTWQETSEGLARAEIGQPGSDGLSPETPLEPPEADAQEDATPSASSLPDRDPSSNSPAQAEGSPDANAPAGPVTSEPKVEQPARLPPPQTQTGPVAGARDEADLPAPQAVVLWIYQPESSKDFEDEGILLGQTRLHKEPTSLGLYGFDPESGLKEYKSPLAEADFRVARDGDKLILICDSDDPDRPERIKPVASDQHPGQEALDRLHARSRYVLKPSSTLFIVCVKGGHALLRVESVLDK